MPKDLIGTRDGQNFYVGNSVLPTPTLRDASGASIETMTGNVKPTIQAASTVSTANKTNPVFSKPTEATDEFTDVYKRSQNALLTDPTPAKSKDQIYQDRLKQSQGIIDSINQNFSANELIASREAATLDKQTRQSMIAQGLAGSSAAVPAIKQTTAANDAVMQSLQAQRANQIQSILTGIQSYADEEFTREQERFKAEAEGNIEMVDKLRKDKLDSMVKATSEFTKFAELSAKSPLTWKELSELEPDTANAWKTATGKDDLELSLLMNKAKTGLDKTVWDDKLSHYDEKRGVMIMIGTKPDGSTVIQEQPTKTKIPSGFKPQMLGDQMFLVDENGIQIGEDGSIKGLMPYGSVGQFDKDKQGANNSSANEFLVESAQQGLRVVNDFLNNFSQTPEGKINVENLTLGRAAAVQEALPAYMQSNTYRNSIANLETIKANIGFGALTKMREASKTGGALGQISDRENLLLQSILGSLDLKQEPEQFYENMRAVEESLNRWNTAVQQYRGQGDTGQINLTPLDTNFSPANPLLQKYPYKEVEEFIQQFPDATEDEIKELTGSFKSAGKPQASDTGMRTDRHANPTAFTTDIAKLAGLKEGVDYVAGDPFSNGQFKTAKLLKDPVKTTIQVIDKIGFFTQNGKQRWSHTAIPQSQWNKMSYEQKKNVVKQMYQKEGNKGILNQYFA